MTVIDSPQGATIEIRERRDNYAKFVIEPLERGFGITFGNALRRMSALVDPRRRRHVRENRRRAARVLDHPGRRRRHRRTCCSISRVLPIKLNSGRPQSRVAQPSSGSRKKSPRATFRTGRRRRDPPAELSHRDADEKRRPSCQMEIGIEKSRGYVTSDQAAQHRAHDRAHPDGLDFLTDPQSELQRSTTRASASRSISIVSRSRSRPMVRSRRTTHCRKPRRRS